MFAVLWHEGFRRGDGCFRDFWFCHCNGCIFVAHTLCVCDECDRLSYIQTKYTKIRKLALNMSIKIRAHRKEPIRQAIIGPMFSGKTSALQAIGRQYDLAGFTVYYVHQGVTNTRDTNGKVYTHDGISFAAVDYTSIEKLADQLDGSEEQKRVILIDEAQFYDSLANGLDRLGALGSDVYFAALNMNFRGEPFKCVRDVLHTCTHIKQLYSVCKRCGCARARYSHRLTDSTEEVEIGGPESYEALCAPCFSSAMA